MTPWLIGLSFIGGYAASIYTWPKVKVWVNGVEVEIQSARDRISQLRAKL